jgi:hypothetical protein
MSMKGVQTGGVDGRAGFGTFGSAAFIAAFFIIALAAFHFAPQAFIPPEAMGLEADEPAGEESQGKSGKPKMRAAESAAAAAEAAAKAAEAAESAVKAVIAADASKQSAPRRIIDEQILRLYIGESDWNFIGLMTLRFMINVIFAYILICVIYAKDHRIKEYSFSFFVSNILIFMVTSLLASVKVRTGFAFGLFAILSILRYRTEQIQIREMTFLFASIILGVLNSLATGDLTIFAVLWANIILCIFVYLCDRLFMGGTDQVLLVYDNTKLLGKGMRKELFEDIKNRFGYDVVKVVIVEMNYLTDSAKVKLVYKIK